MTEKKKGTVGGRRAGSGRKALPSGTITLLVSTPAEEVVTKTGEPKQVPGGTITPVSVTVNRRPTRGVTISMNHWEQIERVRFKNGCRSNSEALRQIIEAGADALKD